MTERMKQLEYELGGEKAKVAELEDKMEGVVETQAEISSLQMEVSRLSEEAKGKELVLERKEKEVEGFRESLRKLREETRAEVEDVEAEIEMLRSGEGLDYEKVIQSPTFTPVFEALRGMTIDSIRATLSTAYPDFNFGPLEEALKPKSVPIEHEKEVEGEKEREKTSPSQKEEAEKTPTQSGEEAEKVKTSSPVSESLNAHEQVFLDRKVPPFP